MGLQKVFLDMNENPWRDTAFWPYSGFDQCQQIIGTESHIKESFQIFLREIS